MITNSDDVFNNTCLPIFMSFKIILVSALGLKCIKYSLFKS